jgi:DNA-binding winged helix-turn-helix (wHTH) protein/tetratricopeptide (TPR) repeat protein
MPGETRIRFGPFVFDRRESRLWRDGSPIDVTPRALGVLDALLERPGQLVMKEELVACVWPRTIVTDAAVAKRVQELRTALGDDPRAPVYVQTLYRRGFKFIGDVVTETVLGVDFVGREPALEQLRRAQRAALNFERGIVLVSGEAGIGKSRLLARFLPECEAAGLQVARGHCSPHGHDQPYLPLVGALTSVARASGDDYAVLLAKHAPSWPRILADDGGDASAAPAALNRHMLLLELCALIGALAARKPLVIAIEDLHWSDPSTLIALDALMRDTARAPLLVVATLRDGALSDDAGWHSLAGQLGHAGHSEVLLARFTEAEVAQYLAARFDADAAVRFAAAVHSRSEGLPLYVSWLGDWVRDAALRSDVDDDDARPNMPDSLARLFELQLTAQCSDALEVLEAASVLGPEFSVESLTRVIDEPVQSTEALLREVLRGSGILTTVGGVPPRRFAFAHGLLHETLYGRIDPARARRLHLRCAELFDGADGDPGEAARHFARAGEPIRAAQMRLAAAATALATHSVEEARRQFEGAVAELRSVTAAQRRDDLEIDALLGLAHCLVASEGYGSPDVQEIYAAALDLSRYAGTAIQRFHAVSGLRGHLVMCARLVEAASYDEALFEAARACGDPVSLASAFTLRAENLMYRGRLLEAGADLVEAERLLANPGDHRADRESWWSTSINMRQIAAQLAGEHNELDRATRHRDAAFALLGRDPNPYLECVSCYFSVAVHMSRDEFVPAAAATARMIELAQAHGFDQLLVWGKTIHGYLLCVAGDHKKGIVEIRDGLARIDASGTRLSRPLIMGSLGLALAQSGALDEALELFDAAQRSIERNGERIREPLLRLQRADALAGVPHIESAAIRVALEQSLDCARTLGFRNIELRVLTRIVARWSDRADELRDLLATMHEGVDTPIMRAARAALSNTH